VSGHAKVRFLRHVSTKPPGDVRVARGDLDWDES
jgi:hypothetical protein